MFLSLLGGPQVSRDTWWQDGASLKVWDLFNQLKGFSNSFAHEAALHTQPEQTALAVYEILRNYISKLESRTARIHSQISR